MLYIYIPPLSVRLYWWTACRRPWNLSGTPEGSWSSWPGFQTCESLASPKQLTFLSLTNNNIKTEMKCHQNGIETFNFMMKCLGFESRLQKRQRIKYNIQNIHTIVVNIETSIKLLFHILFNYYNFQRKDKILIYYLKTGIRILNFYFYSSIVI